MSEPRQPDTLTLTLSQQVRRARGPEPTRRGAALLLVVLAIVISAMVVGTLAQMAVAQRHQMRRERDRLQAFWLVDSGCRRAIAQLATNAEYAGESWRVDVPGSAAAQAGLVTIQVTATEDQRRLEVVAEFPAGAIQRAKLRRELTWSADAATAAADTTPCESSIAFVISPENVVP
jgi:hypothetical protein